MTNKIGYQTPPRVRTPLLVFEGPDGVGKTTIAGRLQAELAAEGIRARVVAFPGNTEGTLGRVIHALHHAPGTFGLRNITPLSQQALHVAAHVDAIETTILPALQRGEWVLLDRFWWSTVVYGRVAGAPLRQLQKLVDFECSAWGGVEPDAVFLLRRDTQAADLAREYERFATGARVPVHTINNNGSLSETVSLILEKVTRLSNGEGTSGGSRHRKPDKQKSSQLQIAIVPKPPTATKVFETYWRFAAERQEMFHRRCSRLPAPWTDDPVLQRHKFTNAYRASDRVSQYLIRNVIYKGDRDPREAFFRTILFKLFNKTDTWEFLNSECGSLTTRSFSVESYDRALARALRRGPIYSGAYIMPSSAGPDRPERKHQAHLALLARMLESRVPEKVACAKSLREVFLLLREQPGLGDFLAFQYAIDLNYGPSLCFDEMSFVVAGPGARNGIRKCFRDLGGYDEAGIIRWVAENQEREFEARGIRFRDLWGRSLQLIDCQNLFCEVDKYARVVHPDAEGGGGRTRIKQLFRPNQAPLEYWFPPRWGINDRVRRP